MKFTILPVPEKLSSQFCWKKDSLNTIISTFFAAIIFVFSFKDYLVEITSVECGTI
jgi:hypothetical protein